MPRAELLARATRAKTLPVMLAPVAVGAALWIHPGPVIFDPSCYPPSPCEGVEPFSWMLFFITLLGAAALHLGANVLNDYFDDRSGVDRLARIDRSAIPTGSQLIETGQMSARAMLLLSALLLAVAGVIGVILAAARGWPILVFGLVGVVLAVGYVGPPLRLAYRGRGLGELTIFAAFGVLPVIGSYYVQAREFQMEALWASIVPGLLTTLVLYHHHFLHWRADKAAGKNTPVVWLEPERALGVSGVVIVATYAVLVIEVALGLFPALALVGLVLAFPLLRAWLRALKDPAPQHYLQLLGATLGASVLTSAAIVLALLVAR